MVRLLPLSSGHYEAWRDLVGDFAGAHMPGSGFWGGREPVVTEQGYAEMLGERAREADPAIEPPEGRVRATSYWILDDDGELVGFLSLRHSLNDHLVEEGGHIGYSVRPSRRREGIARAALAAGLDEARRLGLDRVLVTCDDDNEPSRLTIERNGGVLEDVRNGKRRYWIPL